MKILWFYSDHAGVGTYRSICPAMHLMETGVANVEMVLHQDYTRQTLARMRHDDFDFDIFLFQRAVGPHFRVLMEECRRRGIKTVFDIDDDLLSVPVTNPAAEFWNQPGVRRDLIMQLDLADRVLVSTQPLKDALQKKMRWPDTGRVRVCPNHLRRDVWDDPAMAHITPYPTEGLVIGWQGSPTHDMDFKSALPALERIFDDYLQVRLRLFGATPSTLKEHIDPSRWEYVKGVEFHAYPALLKYLGFDIGIAPLLPVRFNESKSNLKWMEYASLGIPCIAADVYPYSQSIEHGVTGWLAADESEWYDALAQVIEDADLRRRVGQAAREHVWSAYSAERAGPKWADALRSLVEVPRDASVSAS